MNEKHVKVAGYICHALMMNQVMLIDDLFKHTSNFMKGLTRQEYDEINELLNQSGAITGISEDYIYQTTSTLTYQKNVDEIMNLVKGK